MRNPCLACGACCAYFRNSFYWAEAGDATPGGVPVELTERLTPFLRVMRGTNQPKPRCVALDGAIGEAVACSVYEQRPSPCRDFVPSWMDGTPNPRCDDARAAHGLPPLAPDFYAEPEALPALAPAAIIPLPAAALASPPRDPDTPPDVPPDAPQPPMPEAA